MPESGRGMKAAECLMKHRQQSWGPYMGFLALMGWHEEGETRLIAVLDDSTDDEFQRKLGAIEANQQQAEP
jgi:hypothetical protein